MVKHMCTVAVITMAFLEIIQAQRPSYAGIRPPDGLNQKDKYLGTQNTAVENIFGATGPSDSSFLRDIVELPYGAPQRPPSGVPVVFPSDTDEFLTAADRLPIDAQGDWDLVNRLRQLPVEQQPFWLINYKAIEDLRNGRNPNVGAWEFRPNSFGG
ncbi:hypothetical protein KR084_012742 [Drosophila pseudotakahashii]|nr:hypothetical protein KR084_012742 [Drosophila pseudotakahashii]